MSRRPFARSWSVAVSLSLMAIAPVGAKAAVPVITSNACHASGCLPTAEECADGAPLVTPGRHVGAVAVCAAAAGHTAAYVGGNPLYPCGEVTVADTDVVPGDANECDRHVEEPLDAHVYTPKGSPSRGLPSLYLLTGAGSSWRAWGDYGFRPQLIADRYRLVVVAVGGQTTYYVNWADGTVKAERQLMTIIRRVDARYGTSPSGSRRGVLGFSMGGYGATLLAERHPGLFGAVVSLSGVLNIENVAVKANLTSLAPTLNSYSAPLEPNRIWGDPVIQDAHWRAMNPADHVCGLRRAWVWFSSGDGIPAPEDADAGLPTAAHTETTLRTANDDFARALRSHGLRFTYVTRRGVHTARYWVGDVARVLPQLAARLSHGAKPLQPLGACAGAL